MMESPLNVVSPCSASSLPRVRKLLPALAQLTTRASSCKVTDTSTLSGQQSTEDRTCEHCDVVNEDSVVLSDTHASPSTAAPWKPTTTPGLVRKTENLRLAVVTTTLVLDRGAAQGRSSSPPNSMRSEYSCARITRTMKSQKA